jgi:hypothetical protein
MSPVRKTTGQKAAATRKRNSAKRQAAAKKAARTRVRRGATRKAAATRVRKKEEAALTQPVQVQEPLPLVGESVAGRPDTLWVRSHAARVDRAKVEHAMSAPPRSGMLNRARSEPHRIQSSPRGS